MMLIKRENIVQIRDNFKKNTTKILMTSTLKVITLKIKKKIFASAAHL